MNFYVVNNNRFDDNGFAYGKEKGKIITGNAIKCEECGSFLTGLKWLPPLEVKLSRVKLGDVIYGTFDHFIVSERFKDIYDKNNFSGIKSFESVVLYQKGEQITEKYFYPRITLSDTHIDIERSGIVFDGIGECSTCQKAGRVIKNMKGLYISDKLKINSDIFCTKMLPGEILFSENFKEATKDLLNLSFRSAKEYIPSWVIQ